ncbi:recombinase family protein [Inediibacterium massiliense]|uniref:recombinase family protein n=1 Tax=Inediibacterium massiliense TaxID=1658111 RepID=UPI0006B655D1|nr:recombinase family protein [Inediibacterium massiliense]
MRCAVYVRVSTDMDIQKSSLAHQKNFFEKYTKQREWKMYKIYEDIESGKSIKNREGLKNLIEDSKKKEFDIVLTKSISRFARNTLEGLTMIRDLKSRNIRFITIEDGFDSEEYDEFMFTLLLSMAQKESEKIGERIRFGKLCRAKKGCYNGSHPPYGYMKHENQMIPSEDVSTYVVQKIFSMYLGGNGFYKIAKELNDKGYPTPSQIANKKNSSLIWHQSTIRNILSNSFYVGDLVQNKGKINSIYSQDHMIKIQNTHQGIIDRVTFEEVQKKIKENGKNKGSKGVYLFSNLLICGECKSSMHFKKDKEAYLCGKVNKMGKKYCQGAYVHEKDLEHIVRTSLQGMITNHIKKEEGIILEIVEGIKKEEKNKKIDHIEKSIKKLKNKKNRLLDLLIENLIDEQVYQEKFHRIQEQEELLQENKRGIEEKFKKDILEWKEYIYDLLRFKNLDRMTLCKFIKRIEVFHDKKIVIEYDFENSSKITCP